MNSNEKRTVLALLPCVDLCPVVQSIVSLTSSLVVKMLLAIVSTVSNSQIILVENVSSFCKCKSYSHFFLQKYQRICHI